MPDKKITELTALTTPASTDVLPVVDLSGPTTKKSTIAQIGTAIKLDDLATPDDNTDLNVSTSRHGLAPKLPGGTTTFFRADGTYASPGAASLPVVDTTSIVEDPGDATKEMRIDVGAVATATVRVLTMPNQDVDLTPSTGTFPSAVHASRHQNGGADEISVAGLSGLLADGQTPLVHASSHQNGGGDEISVTGLSGLLADAQTPLADAVITDTQTGAVNNWVPGAGAGIVVDTLVLWNGSSAGAFTGMAGGVSGRRVTIRNITAAQILTLAHNSGSSNAGNRLRHVLTSAPTPVAAGGWVTYQWNGTDWSMIDHCQGAAITAAFDAANFEGSGSMGWTVASGDVTALAYEVSGSKIFVMFQIDTTKTTGTASSDLRIKNGAWGGFTAGPAAFAPLTLAVDDNVFDNGHPLMLVNTSGTYIRCLKSSFANWAITAGADATAVWGAITILGV